MKYVFVLALLVSINGATAGGGWLKKKGKSYLKLSQRWIVGKNYYNDDGMSVPILKTGFYSSTIYGEYGFTDRMTGIINFPFFNKTTMETDMVGTSTEAINSLGDLDIAIKYGISNPGSRFAFAGTLQLGLPIGQDSGGMSGLLQTGDGEFNQLIRFDLSRSFSFGKVNIYANLYAAYNNRTENFSDEFRGGGETGISLFNSKLWGIIRLDLVNSFQNGEKSNENSFGGTIYANNTEFFAFTYELTYYVTDKLGVSFSKGGVFNASLIMAAPSYSVGVFFDLK